MVAHDGDEADRRAAALLAAHLDPLQRREYERDGVITVVRHGPVAGVLLRQGGISLLAAAIAALLPVVIAPALIVLILLPLVTPAVAIACLPRRVWRIDPEHGPQLVGRHLRVDFCVDFDGPLPAADRLLGYKNVLQASESTFLRKANVQRVRWARGASRRPSGPGSSPGRPIAAS